jgi:RHS repeat-associated protein
MRLIAAIASLLISIAASAHAPRESVSALPFGEPTRIGASNAARIEQAEHQAEVAAPEPHAQENLSRQQKTAHRAHARLKNAESVRASALTHCLVLESWLFGWKCASGEVIDSYQAIARWYRPGIGRFQSMDPIDGDPMLPVTLNEYLAMHGNPTGVVDPDGRCGVAAAAMQGMGFGAVCDVVDSYMIGTDNREAIKEYRLGSGVGAIRSAVEGVIGGVQLAGDLAMVGRMSPMTAEKLAAMNRVGAVGAGIAEVASDPSLALTDYMYDRKTRFDGAVENQLYGQAGEVVGQTQMEVGSAGTGIAGSARTAVGIATRGANRIRAAINGNTPSVLGEAPNGQISSELADDLGQFERDMPTGGGGVTVAQNDALKLNNKGTLNDQGMPYEDLMGSVPGVGKRLPPNFKTFDYFNDSTGVATSVKTLDTSTASRVSKPERVYSTLRRDINKAANFENYSLQGKSIDSSEISARVVRVAVPRSTNAEQWMQIQRAVQHGREVGVEVIVETVDVQ